MSIAIADIISKELAEQARINKPIEEGEVIQFKLLRAGFVDPSSTKKVVTPQAHILAPKDSIVDPFDKKARGNKIIMNIISYEHVSAEYGKPNVLKPILGYVKFDRTGSIYLKRGEDDQLHFLRLMNKNASNLNRIPSKAKVFYEVDEKKEISVKNNFFTYSTLASNIVMEAFESEKDLLYLCSLVKSAFPNKYNLDMNAGLSKLRTTLGALAQKNPIDLILVAENQQALARVIVDDAVSRRIIQYDDHETKRNWEWLTRPNLKGKRVIVQAKPDSTNPIKDIVDYLCSADGNTHFVELKAEHKEFYKY